MNSGMAYLIKIDTNGNAVLPTLAGNAKKADVSLSKIESTSKKSFSALTQNAARSNSILGKTKSLLAGIGLTLTTGALVAGIVGLGANFQKSMSEVKALTNASAIEMKVLETSARQAGATTEHTALSSSKAMGYLAQAGFNTNQIVSALPGTLNLASAGNLELARSADIATNILTQYRMKASDTGVVVDQLALLQSTFNTTVEESAEAMNYIGPKAASMGVSLGETNAAIGLLASGGYKGSLATRALGTSLVRLSKPTNEMRAKIDELNLKLFDSKGQFVGLADMVGQLQDRYASLTPQQQMNATATLFGAEAVDKWTVLLNAGSDTIRHYTEELEAANGTARRMAETKMDNLAGDFKKLQSASQEIGLQLFEKVSPALRAATTQATMFVQNMDTRQVGLYLEKTVNLLYKGVVWIKNNHRLIIGLGKAYVALKVGMFGYNTGVKIGNLLTATATGLRWAYIAATKSAAVANRALGSSMMMSPLGAIIGLLGLAASAMTMFAMKTKAAKNEVDSLDLDKALEDQNKQENLGLRPSTKKDSKKLEAGGLTQSQYSKIVTEAKERISRVRDQMLDIRAASGINEKDYLSLYDEFEVSKKGKNGADFSPSELQRYMSFISMQDKMKDIAGKKGVNFSEFNQLIKDNKALIDRALPFINDPTLKKTATGEGVVNEAETTSDNVVSGGSKQRVINVTLGNIENNLNFNVQDRLDEISASIEELYGIINNQMVRVFNNANQLAD
jgi:TP901 family phage tail tape measure protein